MLKFTDERSELVVTFYYFSLFVLADIDLSLKYSVYNLRLKPKINKFANKIKMLIMVY